MQKNKKITFLIVLMALFLCISLGYAFLTTTLSINGTTNIDRNTWNVYWNNVQVTTGSVTAPTPTIDTNHTTVTFNAHLSKPGDFYEFTVDAVNDGSIDAMIDIVSQEVYELDGVTQKTLPDCLEFKIEYSDGAPLQGNHLLESGVTETYRVTVSYKKDIGADQILDTEDEFVFQFGIAYVQRSGSAIPVRTTIYNVSNQIFMIRGTIPNVTVYDNYQDAINAWGRPFFLRHTISGDTILESFVGFVVEGEVYYVQGGIPEEGSYPVFEANKAILQEAFGSENCSEWIRDDGKYKNITCSNTERGAFAASDGYICASEIDSVTCECYVHGGGDASCNN